MSHGGLHGTLSKFGNFEITGEGAIDLFSNRIKITAKWTSALPRSPSPVRSAPSALPASITLANITTSNAGISSSPIKADGVRSPPIPHGHMAGRRGASPRNYEQQQQQSHPPTSVATAASSASHHGGGGMAPLSRSNSAPRDGLVRGDSCFTSFEAVTRENSAVSDFSSTSDGSGAGSADHPSTLDTSFSDQDALQPAMIGMQHLHLKAAAGGAAAAASMFHGIAATSPFASKDPLFDFDIRRFEQQQQHLEQLNKDDAATFAPYFSAQPSFEIDEAHSWNPLAGTAEHLTSLEHGSFDQPLSTGSSRDDFSRPAQQLKYYEVDLHAVAELLPGHAEALEPLLLKIMPHETQARYRTSAVRLLKKHLRKALQCNILEVGLHAVRSFLPTDALRLSVVLSGRLEPHWQTLARDGLVKSSQQTQSNTSTPTSSSTSSSSADATAAAAAAAAGGETKHQLKHVEIVKTPSGGGFRVTCVCDATDVEISLNSRSDVCMLAFFEEVAHLVGQNNLFKRSLLLIRAWWVYEAAAYVETSIKHYLSDFNITVMVCAIFNQFHARISSPLQALCLFLAEYSAYDGATHAITLQGIVPFKSALELGNGNSGSNQLVHIIEPSRRHLISAALISKYHQVFHIDQVVATAVKGTAFTTPSAPIGSPSSSSASSVTAAAAVASASVFMRDAFNILHPFQTKNMVRPSALQDLQGDRSRAAHLLATVFSEGAKRLSHCLSKASTDAGGPTAAMNAFFPIVHARFASNWRPDAIGNSTIDPLQYEVAL